MVFDIVVVHDTDDVYKGMICFVRVCVCCCKDWNTSYNSLSKTKVNFYRCYYR